MCIDKTWNGAELEFSDQFALDDHSYDISC